MSWIIHLSVLLFWH